MKSLDEIYSKPSFAPNSKYSVRLALLYMGRGEVSN